MRDEATNQLESYKQQNVSKTIAFDLSCNIQSMSIRQQQLIKILGHLRERTIQQNITTI